MGHNLVMSGDPRLQTGDTKQWKAAQHLGKIHLFAGTGREVSITHSPGSHFKDDTSQGVAADVLVVFGDDCKPCEYIPLDAAGLPLPAEEGIFIDALVFQQVLQKTLKTAASQGIVALGRLTRPKQSYKLESFSPEEFGLIQAWVDANLKGDATTGYWIEGQDTSHLVSPAIQNAAAASVGSQQYPPTTTAATTATAQPAGVTSSPADTQMSAGVMAPPPTGNGVVKPSSFAELVIQVMNDRQIDIPTANLVVSNQARDLGYDTALLANAAPETCALLYDSLQSD